MASAVPARLPPSFNRLAWSNLAAQSAEQLAVAAAPIVVVLALGGGAAETGLIQTAHTLPFLLFAIPAGMLVDRMSRRSVMAYAEALRVVSLIAILALGLVPLTQLASQRAKEQELRAALRDIRTAIDAYKKATDENRVEKKADETGYPPDLAVLAKGVKDIKTPDGKMIYFMRRVPRDPFFDDSSVPADKTWGLRSYASPPDEPKEGDDVYDVYSLSKRKGLNGVEYKDW